ncbi:MAG: MoaD/ThiS family protein [Gammaproteobacteria bacterium]|nr:MoaD/ThiS family protein [Gammaproteobacteria bacterium]
MATVWIPGPLAPYTGGESVVQGTGTNVQELLDSLERVHAGIRAALLEDGRLRRGIAVVVDGQVASRGLLSPVRADSEVHFVPAIGGG